MIGYDDQVGKVSPEKLGDPAGEPSELDWITDLLYEATQNRDCLDLVADRMGDVYPVRGILMAVLEWLESSGEGAGAGDGPEHESQMGAEFPTPDRQGGEGPVDEEGPGLSPKSEPRRGLKQECDDIHGELSGPPNGPVWEASAGVAAGPNPEETVSGSGEAPAETVKLPAGLIDRAVKEAEISLSPERPDGRHLRGTVEAVAPLLVEHGRQQALIDVARNRKIDGEELTNGANQLIEMGERAEREKWVARIEMKAAERDAAVASQTRQANLASEQGRYRGAADSKDSADWFESQAQLLRSLLTEEEA